MYKLTSTLSLLFAVTLWCSAQTYVYSSEREYCAYNTSNEEFDKCDSWEDHTLFIVDARETKFDHYTDDIKSTYFIDKKEWNDDMEMNLWYVTSDAGNKYTCIFNLEGGVIAMLYDNGDESFIVTFTITKKWK